MPINKYWVPNRTKLLEDIEEEEKKLQELQQPPLWQRALQFTPWGPISAIPQIMQMGQLPEEYYFKPMAQEALFPTLKPPEYEQYVGERKGEMAGALGVEPEMIERLKIGGLVQGIPWYAGMTPGKGELTPALPGGELREIYEKPETFPKYVRGATELGMALPHYMLGGQAFGATGAGKVANAALNRAFKWVFKIPIAKYVKTKTGFTPQQIKSMQQVFKSYEAGMEAGAWQNIFKSNTVRYDVLKRVAQLYPKNPEAALAQFNAFAKTDPEFVKAIQAHIQQQSTLKLPGATQAATSFSRYAETMPMAGGLPRATPSGQLPQGTIQTPAVTPQMAQQQIAREFLQPIQASMLDTSATTYLNTGSFAGYLSEMARYYKIPSIEEAKALGIALRTTKGGKLVPSMRQSGFYVTDEFAKYKGFQDVSSPSGQAQDPTRLLQNIQGGIEEGPATKYILWPTRRTALAAYNFSDTQKYANHKALQDFGLAGKPQLQRAAGWVIEHISQAEATAPVGDLLAKPEIAKLLSRYPIATQGAIARYAQWGRKFFDNAIKMQNEARAMREQTVIPYRENYLPWVVDENIWSKTFGIRAKPKGIKGVPEMPDYIVPTKPFNPRELARRGGLTTYLKEKNLTKLIDDYAETAMKDIFYTNIIHNARVHTAQLHSMGYRNSADLIERWVTEAYGGVSSPIDRAIRRVVPNKVVAAQLALRRRLQSAVFPLNWTWNVFVQTSSIALSVARYGIANTAKGLDYLFSKNAKDYVRNQCYSHTIKTRMGGTVSQQDLAQSITKVYNLEATKIERAEHAANFLTHTIEEKLTGVSCRAAYYDGLAKGYKDRALIEHASDGGAKTQSMYNREDLPGVLRSRILGATVPFQTFAFEVFNTCRELAGRAGAYQATTEVAAGQGAKVSRRVKLILEWIAAILVIQIVADKAINRKPWSSSAFLPYFAVLTGGVNAGNPWNQVLPLKYSQDLHSGIRDAARYGNFRKLRKWALQYHAIGGVQMARTIEGIEAVNKGEVTDVSGRTLFRVKPNEWWRAITMGVYSTEGGREYIDKMQEAKGPAYEYTGIPGWKMPEKEGALPQREPLPGREALPGRMPLPVR